MAQSLFKTLKESGECSIDVIAPQWSLPLLERMPEVSNGIALSVGHGEFSLKKRCKTGKGLRAKRYDHAIVLPRSFKSALVPFFARAKIRTGYRGEMRYGLLNDIRHLDKQILTRTVERYVALGHPADAPQPPVIPQPELVVNKGNQKRIVDKLNLDTDRPIIGFMPGAEYGPAKQWPGKYYGELASQLYEKGYQIWQFGSAKDQPFAAMIDDLSGGITRNLCGETELVDVIDLIDRCDAVVSNDSGLMHVAAATGTPLVGIYGSSTPDYTPPLTENAEVLYLGLECSPCFKRHCPLGHGDCLGHILPQQAFEAVERVVERTA